MNRRHNQASPQQGTWYQRASLAVLGRSVDSNRIARPGHDFSRSLWGRVQTRKPTHTLSCHERLLKKFPAAPSSPTSPLNSAPTTNEPPAPVAVLAPHLTKNTKTVAQALRQPLGLSAVPYGCVYGLSLPHLPGIVKVGFSKIGGAARLKALQPCMPGAVIVFETWMPNPQRMERLIHLELSKHRRCMNCEKCGRKHQEFFDVPAGRVEVLASTWQQLVELAPLYDPAQRTLTAAWRRRLGRVRGDVTAAALLKVLQRETERLCEEGSSE